MNPKFEHLLKDGIIDEQCNVNWEKLAQLPAVDEDNGYDKLFGDDDRDLVSNQGEFPYSAIVRLVMTYSGNNYQATGFVVGDNKIVTAGHAIYNAKLGGNADKVTVIAKNENLDEFITHLKLFKIDPNFLTRNEAQFDWAVFKTDDNVAAFTGKLIPVNWYENVTKKCEGEIAGFPQTAWGAYHPEFLYTAKGEVSSSDIPFTLTHKIPTSQGQSGSPVIIQVGGSYFAAGIHVKGLKEYNAARAIDSELLQTIIQF